MRQRLERGFDQFIDARALADIEVAELARRIGIDIAVDLGGYTEFCRTTIFALRTAPIQLSYIGYLGTMAAPYMDYLVADATLIPAEQRAHYDEKIIYLPSYQVNHSQRRISERIFTREELGLPPSGFVFSCFNANYKILPEIFLVWMRILKRVLGASLFLYVDNEAAVKNLRREAQRAGVDERRIVFGGRVSVEEYLARYRVMDLFLDTLPYNAGTTASDALWVGVPVVTCIGKAFAGRYGASLLSAMEMPELIAQSLGQYEDLAVELANDPSRLQALRDKLAVKRETAALFDTERFTRSLETAYQQIFGLYLQGLPPQDIIVGTAYFERYKP